jgi:hypothetical protein
MEYLPPLNFKHYKGEEIYALCLHRPERAYRNMEFYRDYFRDETLGFHEARDIRRTCFAHQLITDSSDYAGVIITPTFPDRAVVSRIEWCIEEHCPEIYELAAIGEHPYFQHIQLVESLQAVIYKGVSTESIKLVKAILQA